MNWELYQKAYQNAPPELRELLDSERIPLCVKNSLRKRDLLSLRKKVVAEIAAYFVGIQTIDEVVKKLTGIGIPDARQLLVEIQTSIDQINPAADTQPSAPKNLSSEISDTEHDLASLQTVRTMSHDMAAIKPGSDVVYQSSSQADILRTPDVGELPNVASATSQTTRWDTDTH